MNIIYDGLTTPREVITLTNVPNILTIDSENTQGSKAELHIKIEDLTLVDLSKEYKITINGVTIMSANKANNKYFFLSNKNEDKVAVATSITKTLRNTDLINYDIYLRNADGVISEDIIILAKEIGGLFNITYETDLGQAVSLINLLGSTSDTLVNNKISVDVFSLYDYITTLDKTYYKDNIDFNLSQVLTTISLYDSLTPYKLVMYANEDSKIRSLGVVDTLYSAVGYMCNQGKTSIPLNGNQLALNVKRGSRDNVYNGTVLYTYLSTIPLSVYSTYNSVLVQISYLDSDETIFKEDLADFGVINHVCNANVLLDELSFSKAFYIDLTILDIGVIRYNVIKPISAASRCQRVYYHNSYGGISFFDFTGEIVENHKVDNDTYTKNTYDYYKSTTKEETKVYNKETSIVVTMKSHLMEADARWQFNDLLGSYDVWTIVNNVRYKIIITDCKVDETETGVWEATVTYTYSLI